MVVLSVFYPAAGGTRFDHDYYDTVHIPLVREAFGPSGLTDIQVLKALPGPDGAPPPYLVIANLFFRDLEALKASRAGPRGGEVRADVANYTDIAPITQISRLG